MPISNLGLEHVSLSYATTTVFNDVTRGVSEGDRIGIVGRNGDGKSTLLNLLAGLQEPDSGRVMRRGGLTMGMLEQRDHFDDTQTVLQAALLGKDEYEWAADPRSRDIVNTLLAGVDLNSHIGDLSGGQRRRADLMRLLLTDWDILALDEPTNHLDIVTIHWLADHLKRRWPAGSGSLLIVTHDRWFLDEVCTSMWEVHDGTIDPFEGGYSAYMLQRVERDRQADVREERRRNLARKELAWLSRGARARSTKQKFHVKQAQALIADVPPMRNTLQLKQMALSRLGKQVVDMVDVTYRVPLGGIEDGQRTHENVATNEVSVEQRTIFDNVTWLVGPGDRFGIVGANGVGKTTLLNLITGRIKPQQGRVCIGKTVKFAVLSQQLEELRPLEHYRISEVLSRYKSQYEIDGTMVTPGKLMERLGFESAQLMSRIGDLSGGQRRRMQLLLILLDEPNVLILDEPGNDLDTDMLAVLEDVLDTWAGTLLVVSHDQHLLERVTDHQFAVIGNSIRHLSGGVDDYLKLIEEQQRQTRGLMSGQALKGSVRSSLGKRGTLTGGNHHLRSGVEESYGSGSGGQLPTTAESVLQSTTISAAVNSASSPTSSSPVLTGKAFHEAAKRVSAIERKFAKLAERKEDLEGTMATHDPSDYVGLHTLHEQLKEILDENEALELEWLELSEQLDR